MERQAAPQTHADSLAPFRAAIDAVAEPVFVVDLRANRVREANLVACRLLGLPLSQIRHKKADELLAEIGIHPVRRHETPEAATELDSAPVEATEMISGTSFQWQVVDGPAIPDGIVVVVGRLHGGIRPFPDSPVPNGPVPECRADPLTRLPDRAAFEARLARQCNPAVGEDGKRFAVLFLDLDGFKAVNDRLGHRGGDALLRKLAQRLHQAVRPGDLVARFGGDEFTVLLDGVRSASDAGRVAQRLLALPSALAPDGVGGPAVAMSIGIALGCTGMNPEVLVDAADRAMYRAKAAGGNTWAVADAATLE